MTENKERFLNTWKFQPYNLFIVPVPSLYSSKYPAPISFWVYFFSINTIVLAEILAEVLR